MVSPEPSLPSALRREAGAASEPARTPAHYQTTFTFAGVGLARVGLDGAFVDVNQRLCDMIGYAREDLLGSRFQNITHPGDLDRNEDYLAKVMAGELDSYRFEKRYIKANGEILWADLTATLERDAEGRPFEMISIVADIGAFKIAEERMNFLIGELAHRSKNLFAVVLSVINQIGSGARTVPEFQWELEQRIRGLAVSQDLMLGNAGHISSLHDLARQQLRAFVEPADPRVRYVGRSPVLGRNATRVLGMALHELATNACKYGALTSAHGNLSIDCELEDGPDPAAIICWTEREGPPVEAPERAGFGRKVIERMVARSLNAQVDLRFDRRGVEWRCRVRMADLSL